MVDTANNIYFSDNNTIRKIDPSGIVTRIAGTGSTGYSGDGGPATSATFNDITSLAIDPLGNIYLTDRFNNRVRVINTAGIISTFIGNGAYSTTGDGGAPSAATCGWPCAITVDAAGTIYLADEGGERIRKISGGIINTIARSGCMGCGGFTGNGGLATAATFNAPVGIAVDAVGNVYVSDFYNRRIRVINTSGIMLTYAGNGMTGYAGDGGPATAAKLNENWGVAITPGGELLIADQMNYRIRKVDAAGIITTYAGTGTTGYTGDGGPATSARIANVPNIATDRAGNVYIPDRGNYVIRKVSNCLPVLAPVTGATHVCAGSSITVNCDTPGGVWSSGNPSIATVSATGTVFGVAAGTAHISYSATNSCGTAISAATITVEAMPLAGATSGPTAICRGASAFLTTSVAGGTWASADTAAAVVAPAGMVTALVAGQATFFSIQTNACGSDSAMYTLSVDTLFAPGVVNGDTFVCMGSTMLLSAADTPGLWYSGNLTVATVATTGLVNAILAGSTTITYVRSNSCGSVTTLHPATVQVQPNAGIISGPSSVCADSTVALINPTGGGVWSSTATSVALVSPAGIVTGLVAGTSVISYTVTNSCGSVSAIQPLSVMACAAASIDDTKGNIIFEIAPNPNNGSFYVSGTVSYTGEKIWLEITDLSGKSIYTSAVAAKDGKYNENINLANKLTNGVYLLTIHAGNSVQTYKIIVIR